MIYIIVGPTGSGKTDIAICLSTILDCPIINADAFQIYQDMNIGTNKISKDDPNYLKHYLLDIVTPEVSYSVKEYQEAFRKTVNDLSSKYQNIIVCGGTGLYIRASIYDYLFLEEKEASNFEYEKYSDDELYKLLKEKDPEIATNIHQNNRKRVIRALEVYFTSGKNKSEIIANQNHTLIYENVKIIFINPPREQLYENINKRVDKMIELGLVEEVQSLKKKYNLSTTAYQAIGYKEILDYLDDKYSLTEAIELIKKRTRNYAKRQVTFFKHQFENVIEYNFKEKLLEDIKNGSI